MKTFAAASVAASLVVVLAVAGAAGARSQASNRISLSGPMTAAQEVPAPTGDLAAARGAFSGTVTRTGADAVLNWTLTFSGLTGPVGAAHIHLAARGTPGPVAVPLCGPCTSPATGTANLADNVLQALQTGGAYANVHTTANGAGELRGQIGVVANVRTQLTARQEVPKPKGSVARARALLTGVVTRSGPTGAGTLVWRLTFSGLTGPATGAHIHTGARGVAGPVAVPLCGPCRNGRRGTTALRAGVLAALEAGRAYVNVHTSNNQAGEVRGQIAAVPLRLTGP